MKQSASYQICFFSCLAIWEIVTGSPITAQIIPDQTLPTNSIVIPQGNSYLIEGGTRSGTNLFHSFQEFSLPAGRGALFNNASDIQNIFSRITGKNISNIDGLIKANGTANLFLINPNGIIFGPNARLSIGGSFLASTANSIKFADSTEFSATVPQNTSLLTLNVPIGLQFGTASGSIVVKGIVPNLNTTVPSPSQEFERSLSIPPDAIVKEAIGRVQNVLNNLQTQQIGLQVLPGKTLALIGGNIILESGLLTAGGQFLQPGGRIELGSVNSNSSVTFTPTTNGWIFNYEEVKIFGNINLSQRSFLNANGSSGGDIHIEGDRVTLTDNSTIFAATTGSKNGGEITIRATELNVSNDSILGGVTLANGNSGNINLELNRLNIQNGFIGSLSLSQGNAGNLSINATDTMNLSGTLFSGQLPSGIFAATGLAGLGGNLTIQTGKLTIQEGAQIAVTTGGIGRAGTAIINASDSVTAIGESTNRLFSSGIFASSFGIGAAGDLNIETQRLIVKDGAAISAATRGARSGTLVVKASDSVQVIGTTANGQFFSDLSANTLGSGTAGDVRIETNELIVRDGGQITAATRGPLATGAAGNLTIEARRVRLNSGTITAETKAGNFGNIALNSNDLQIRRNSRITTNATGTGGNITINSDVIAALENSDITANSIDSQGGQVSIKAQGIFGAQVRREPTLTTSDITASSQLGPQFDGVVDIQTPDVDPTQGLLSTPQIVNPPRITTGCQAVSREVSNFIITGTGGVPLNPAQPLTSEAIWIDARSTSAINYQSENQPQKTEIVEAQGWIRGKNGEIILIAQTLVTPANFILLPASCK